MSRISIAFRALSLLAIVTTTLTTVAYAQDDRPLVPLIPVAGPNLADVWLRALPGRDDERLPKKLDFGLKITNAKEGQLSGSFSAGTERIYLEVVRGEANDRTDADAPTFGLDIRIMDRDRTPFVLQTAGSAPISAAWHADSVRADSVPINVEGRQRAFALFPGAARALRAYAANHPDLQPEISGLIELLEYYTVDKLFDIDGPPQDEGGVTATATTQATYTHKATIRKKRSNINLPWREYEHSALILDIYKSGGALLTSWYTSNHGTAATSSLMSTKCTRSFTKTNISFNMWDIMCESYGSVWPVQHLCNNDTREEYLSVKNSSTQNWGVCKSFWFYAPDCD